MTSFLVIGLCRPGICSIFGRWLARLNMGIGDVLFVRDNHGHPTDGLVLHD